MIYKEGSKDTAMVRQIQKALNIPTTGVFDSKMTLAVVAFQRDHNLVADGLVGRKTLDVLGILDTDLNGAMSFKTSNNLIIYKHYLPQGEYLVGNPPPIYNDYVMLHHTAGWHNPYQTVDVWPRIPVVP